MLLSQLLQCLCTSGLHEHLLFSEPEQGELSPTSASEMSVLQAVIPHSRSDVWALYPSVAASFHRALGHLGLDNHQSKMILLQKERELLFELALCHWVSVHSRRTGVFWEPEWLLGPLHSLEPMQCMTGLSLMNVLNTCWDWAFYGTLEQLLPSFLRHEYSIHSGGERLEESSCGAGFSPVGLGFLEPHSWDLVRVWNLRALHLRRSTIRELQLRSLGWLLIPFCTKLIVLERKHSLVPIIFSWSESIPIHLRISPIRKRCLMLLGV